MRLSTILVVLAAPLLALSKVVINNTSYSGGVLHLGISTYSDAPSSYNVVAVDSKGNKYNIGTINTGGSGTLDVALPGNTPAGSYKVQVTDPSTGEVLSTSKSFTVKASDLASASSAGLQSASYGYSVTGTIIPFVTTSLVTDAYGQTTVATVTISGPAATATTATATTALNSTTLTVTTDSLSTGVSGTSTVPVSSTITGLVSTGTDSSGAATATLITSTAATTSRSAGYRNTVTGGAFVAVAAVLAGAAMLY